MATNNDIRGDVKIDIAPVAGDGNAVVPAADALAVPVGQFPHFADVQLRNLQVRLDLLNVPDVPVVVVPNPEVDFMAQFERRMRDMGTDPYLPDAPGPPVPPRPDVVRVREWPRVLPEDLAVVRGQLRHVERPQPPPRPVIDRPCILGGRVRRYGERETHVRHPAPSFSMIWMVGAECVWLKVLFCAFIILVALLLSYLEIRVVPMFVWPWVVCIVIMYLFQWMNFGVARVTVWRFKREVANSYVDVRSQHYRYAPQESQPDTCVYQFTEALVNLDWRSALRLRGRRGLDNQTAMRLFGWELESLVEPRRYRWALPGLDLVMPRGLFQFYFADMYNSFECEVSATCLASLASINTWAKPDRVKYNDRLMRNFPTVNVDVRRPMYMDATTRTLDLALDRDVWHDFTAGGEWNGHFRDRSDLVW